MVGRRQNRIRRNRIRRNRIRQNSREPLKCHCSAVAISIQYHKVDHHLCGLHEALQSSVCEISGEFGLLNVT
jgi:hypothetical protein